MPEGLNDGVIYEFLNKINLELTWVIRDWLKTECSYLKKDIEKEYVHAQN